ncbi:MAG TPA: polysaccharide biosynthesis tyrosine autokinase [Acetobacteraceae bacterium]|nr:polysaccharide biosynthesis tyrosine autokinase [Acetobacteraceae bacterium]
MVQRPETPVGLIQDPAVRLEPLGVPFGRFTAILRRHVWVVILSVALGVGGTAFLMSRMTKQYVAEALVLIEPQRTQVSDLQAITPDSGDVGSLMRTQIDIMRSPALQMGVVKALDLVNNPEFAPKGGGLRAALHVWLRKLGVLPATQEQPLAPADPVETAAAILSGKLSFINEAKSSVLRVLVTTSNAELSADIGNEMVKQFLGFKRQEKFVAMQRAHDWFQEQMGKLSEEVRATELTVEKYRQEHGLSEEGSNSNGAPASPTVNRQQLDTVSRTLVDVRRERALKEAQLAQAEAALRGKGRTNTLPEVVQSPLVAQLQAQAAAVAGREAQLAAAQGNGNPELASVRAQLHKLQARTEQEMANVATSLRTEVKAARTQEEALQQRMEELRSAVSNENLAEVGLQSLQTKARATRSIYESFLNRATQLANVSGIQEPDASLVSGARPPLGPSSPGGVRLLGVAAVLSTALGVALACLIERLRGGFSSPEQLEAQLGLPLVALVPKVPRGRARRGSKSRSALALGASLDNLRGQMRVSREGRPRLVMITSALPKEGKSVFAAELASNAASAGWRVLLIECDFGCPSIATQFGLRPTAGLHEILTGAMLGDSKSVIHGAEPRLHVIQAGNSTGDPQELLASERMSHLLSSVRERYDLVLLDTPPVLPVADALVLARQADATLMVVRWEKTTRTAAQDALRLLRESGAHVMGAVMTRIDLRKAALAGGRMSYMYRSYSGYHIARSVRTEA